MSILGNIFGTKEAVDDIMDSEKGHLAKFGGWIGNQQFTDQERAEWGAGVFKAMSERLKALEPFKVVQRIMVFAIMFIWAVGAIAAITAIFLYTQVSVVDGVREYTNPQFKLLLTFLSTDYMTLPIVSAVGLYLGGGLINTFMGAPKK